MVKYIEREIEERDRERHVAYYYDSNPLEEDFVLESTPHAELVRYLILVLQWHLRDQDYTVYENLGFYQTRKSGEKPVAPDIALIKGMTFQAVRSWKIGMTGSTPRVTFEILSEETGDNDLLEKPAKYARMGVEEYFAYDLNTPLVKKGTTTRLYGWQLNKAIGLMQAMIPNSDGSLWSSHLESFLVPDKEFLRLYDRNGHLRLTEAEAEKHRADTETRRANAEARRAEAEAEAKRTETRRADAEAEAKRTETRRADAEAEAKRTETRRADAEKKRAEALAEKLRSLGIDPNEI